MITILTTCVRANRLWTGRGDAGRPVSWQVSTGLHAESITWFAFQSAAPKRLKRFADFAFQIRQSAYLNPAINLNFGLIFIYTSVMERRAIMSDGNLIIKPGL